MAVSRNAGLAAIALVCFASVAMALVAQHRFEMLPCPWCVLQRLLFVLIGVVALVGLAWRSAAGRRTVLLLIMLLCSLGIAAALWQHFVAAASASCNLTLADKLLSSLRLSQLLPDVFEPKASCADAAVELWGLPFEFWSLALFAALEGAALWLLVRGRVALSEGWR